MKPLHRRDIYSDDCKTIKKSSHRSFKFAFVFFLFQKIRIKKRCFSDISHLFNVDRNFLLHFYDFWIFQHQNRFLPDLRRFSKLIIKTFILILRAISVKFTIKKTNSLRAKSDTRCVSPRHISPCKLHRSFDPLLHFSIHF